MVRSWAGGLSEAAVVVIVVLGVFGVILLCSVWARLASSRAERRSMDTYEHVLGVLGNVSRRSDSAAEVHLPTADELARTHVHAPNESASTQIPPIRSGPPRIRLSPNAFRQNSADLTLIGALNHDPNQRTLFDSQGPVEQSDQPVQVEAVVEIDDDAAVTHAQPGTDIAKAQNRPRRARRRTNSSTARRESDIASAHFGSRRAVTGAAAAVAVGALAVGGWQLAGNFSNHATPSAQGNHPRSSQGHQSQNQSQNQSSSFALQPASISAGNVAYAVADSSYALTFTTTGTCWLGVDLGTSTTGSWPTQKTLEPNSSWTYQANGSVTVRVGNPNGLSIQVNGQPVVLTGAKNPYDVTFETLNSTSA